jgi:hypothetical protein
VDHGWTRAKAGWIASHEDTGNLIDPILNPANAAEPGRLLVALDGEDLAIRWYPNEGARSIVIRRFERLPTYTSIDLAGIMETVYLRLE